jgi:hypothetical protein
MADIPDDEPDGPLSAEQAQAVAQLSPEQIAAIDQALLAHADRRWRKVAYLVGSAMMHSERARGIPDIFYAQRVAHLVASGLLQSAGNLEYMRYSEVRLPESGDGAT